MKVHSNGVDLTIDILPTKQPAHRMLLAHGAGADMHHPFMVGMQKRLAARGILCARFNFPYTEQGRKSPDKAPRLLEAWAHVTRAFMAETPELPLHLAGKSMGGRMASMWLAEGTAPQEVRSLVFLGYPLHPPGQSDRLRVEHLPRVPCPMLFVSGTKDKLAQWELLRSALKPLPRATLYEVTEGDHSLAVPKRVGETEQLLDRAADAIRSFCDAAAGFTKRGAN